MTFVKPISFQEALDLIGDKSAIGAMLNSSEWGDVPVALRLRAMFSANVENVRFLDRAQNALGDFLDANKVTLPDGQTMLATGGRAAFIQQMREFAISEGMGPLDPEDAGGLQDITSERRLGLIFDTQTRQAQDYGYWRQGQDPDVLNEFPASRFIRVLAVNEPRLNHIPYENQVYLKTDPIWARVINRDFGVPWGPWGWGCGHDVEDVDRTEAVSLGLLEEGQRVEPNVKNFNENLQASARGLDPDLLAKLKDIFGKRLDIQGDTMAWNPYVPQPRPAVQPGKSVLPEALNVEEADLAERRGTEKAVALDMHGNIVLQRDGSSDSVALLPSDKARLLDAVLTHNHPIGLSFSEADIRSAVKFNLSELRAVGVRNAVTYSLQRPAMGWPAQLPLRYGRIFDEVVDEFTEAVLQGKMTDEDARLAIADETMRRLAAEMDLDYERTPRP